MATPTFTMRQLLEAGVHFGHHTRRWNPKMAPYIFGVRNNTHIIDLEQTVPMLYQAMEAVRDVAAKGGRVLFVGTKRQASDKVAEAAKRCGQYYVNHRWLGGMLTNWKTISISIRRLRELDEKLAEDNVGLTKKELLNLTRERDKLERALGGIKEMGNLPDILFVIDTNKEEIAVREARKLKVPVVAVIDSNSNPDQINYPVPGNDDSLRAINLYCDLIAESVIGGLQEEMILSGADIGEAEEAPVEPLPADIAEPVAAEPAAEAADKPVEPEAAPTEAEADKPAEPEAAEKNKPAEPEAAPPEAAEKNKPAEPEAAPAEAPSEPQAEESEAQRQAG